MRTDARRAVPVASRSRPNTKKQQQQQKKQEIRDQNAQFASDPQLNVCDRDGVAH
jgi:hypothetical protein